MSERDDYEIDMVKIEQEMATLYNTEDHYLTELQMSGLIGMCPKEEELSVKIARNPLIIFLIGLIIITIIFSLPCHTIQTDEKRKIVSGTNPEEWRLEVERVLPQLSIPVIDGQ